MRIFPLAWNLRGIFPAHIFEKTRATIAVNQKIILTFVRSKAKASVCGCLKKTAPPGRDSPLRASFGV